jgi:hypothetical protein
METELKLAKQHTGGKRLFFVNLEDVLSARIKQYPFGVSQT